MRLESNSAEPSLTPSPSEVAFCPDEVPYYAKALAMGIPAVLFGLLISGWIAFIPGALVGHADFRQLYAAGYIVRNGMAHQLYDYEVQKAFQDRYVSPEAIALPFIRPAYQAMLFVPFTFISYRAAYWAMLGLNLSLLSLSFRTLSPYMSNLRAIWKWLPVAIFASFFPTGAAIIQGQDSILLLTLLVAAFVALSTGKELQAGALTALGLFKFQFVIPIALLFLVWRRWRFVAGFATVTAGLASLSVWLTGTAQTSLYIRSLFSLGAGLAFIPHLLQYSLPVQMMANFHGLVWGTSQDWLSSSWQLVAAILLSFAFLVWITFKGLRIDTASPRMLLAIPCSVLVSYYAFIHDLSVLLLPLIVMLNATLPRESRDDTTAGLINRSATLLFVAPVLASFVPDSFYLVAVPILLFCIAISPAIPLMEIACHSGKVRVVDI